MRISLRSSLRVTGTSWRSLSLAGLLASGLLATTTAAQSADVSKLTARPSPEWVKDGVIYEIFPRTFSPRGDFQGVIDGLPRLRQLGVTIIWLMPIHPIGEVKRKGSVGSPYAVKDYYDVNPSYGTKADFKRLVQAAHANGIKVLIDEVPNHTSWDNPMLKTPGLHARDAKGEVISPYDWSDVAQLDYKSPKLRQYMTDLYIHWIKEYDIDGYRMDVAWNVPVDFWEELRPKLEAVKKDIFLLAEAHQANLIPKAFDADYSWPLYHAAADVVQQGKSATAVREAWETERATYPKGAIHMRLPDSHDEKRAITRFGERGALAMHALMLTLDGLPLLYQGNEVGDPTESGAPALFEKMPTFWDMKDRVPQFAEFFREMMPLRANSAALRRGDVQWVHNADPDRIVSFLRTAPTDTMLVVINLSNRRFGGGIEVSGSWDEVGPGAKTRTVGLPAIALDGWGYRVFRKRR